MGFGLFILGLVSLVAGGLILVFNKYLGIALIVLAIVLWSGADRKR